MVGGSETGKCYILKSKKDCQKYSVYSKLIFFLLLILDLGYWYKCVEKYIV